MSSCCGVPGSTSSGATFCPVSGAKGRPIELQTVKALLSVQALRRLTTSNHRFCPERTCEVVYFDESGQVHAKADVRVPVWQKEPFGARMICYCFGENEADIHAEIEATGKSEAVERVRAHIRAGRCACEVRNPRGVCCLGNVGAAVKRVAATLAPVAESGT